MYSAQPNAADSATINPAALASSGKSAATLPNVIHEPSRPLPLSRGAPWPALRCAALRGAALSQHRRPPQRDHRNASHRIASLRSAAHRINFAKTCYLSDQNPRGVKRSRSPGTYEAPSPGLTGDEDRNPRKRGKPMKSNPPGSISESPTQAPVPMQQSIPPQTPQSQNAPLPGPQPSYTPSQASASSPPKPTPTKSTLKALPTVRDHTTDQLGPGGDEYLPREIDESGEKKVMPNGQLLGGREYRCRTFLVPNRGDKLFMLATECARVLGYRDSYLLFNKNRSLFKIIANQTEKDDLVSQEILPFSYRSRQIAIVTARSMFRQFGSRVIVNGRRVRDDYWETKARKQGFTEADLAGEKRPGASKAREAAAAAEQNASLLGGPQGEIVYSNNPAQFGGAPHPQLIQQEYPDSRRTDYSSILKTGPRQEITGPPYQDRSQPTAMPEIHAQAHHAAEYNRSVNQQLAALDVGRDAAAALRSGPKPESSANDDCAAVLDPDSGPKPHKSVIDDERYGPSSKPAATKANKLVFRVYRQHAADGSGLWVSAIKPDVATDAADTSIRIYPQSAGAAVPPPATELHVTDATLEHLWLGAARWNALLRHAGNGTRIPCPIAAWSGQQQQQPQQWWTQQPQ
ncbi:RSC complex subunit Rsc7 [Diaporthe eres]|nr:RSC complex subunit Rsc7 [Diaporthe eres]